MRILINYLLILFIGLALSHSVYAKKKPNDKGESMMLKNSISLNISEPILKVLSKNTSVDSGLNLKAPILYYGKQTSKMLYRIGARAAMKNTMNESDLFSDKKKFRYNRYDLTLSALRVKSIHSKINIAYGIAANGFYLEDKKIYDSGFDQVTFDNYSWSTALGPQCLIQYTINKRLSLFTEYFLAFQYSTSYSGKKFSAFPDQNYANDKSHLAGIQFDYPISIYLTYHF